VLVNLDRSILDTTPQEERELEEIVALQQRGAASPARQHARLTGPASAATAEAAERGTSEQTTRRTLASDDVS
jgi:hypothetical protein